MSYERCTARTGKGEQCSREVAYTGADLCSQHGVALPRRAGWYGMACFNGLSSEQQHRVVHWGNLPFGYEPEGTCPNGAEVEVTTMWDEFPGPRFYCRGCAIAFLESVTTDRRSPTAPDPTSTIRPLGAAVDSASMTTIPGTSTTLDAVSPNRRPS